MALGILVLLSGSGCYYADLARGQARLLSASRSIDDVQKDPETSASLRAQLDLVQRARENARQLGLTVQDQYTSFVPWPGDRILTIVVATRPRETQAAGFSFLLVGTLPYKGFFEVDDAETEAETLRQKGLDVCVSPVTAYSTLGWLDDPVTEPMLRARPGRIVETVTHELVHATVFVPEDADFNESAATFIGQEASIRFFANSEDAAARRAEVNDARLLARTLSEFQERIGEVYASEASDAEVARQREGLEDAFRKRVAELSFQARTPEDARALSAKIRLNDACLALRTTYAADLPAFEARLAARNGDLALFIEELQAASQEKDPRSAFLGHGKASTKNAPLTEPRTHDGSGESPEHPAIARDTGPASE